MFGAERRRRRPRESVDVMIRARVRRRETRGDLTPAHAGPNIGVKGLDAQAAAALIGNRRLRARIARNEGRHSREVRVAGAQRRAPNVGLATDDPAAEGAAKLTIAAERDATDEAADSGPRIEGRREASAGAGSRGSAAPRQAPSGRGGRPQG